MNTTSNGAYARALFLSMRPAFLLLTPVSLWLSLSVAWAEGFRPAVAECLMLLAAALMAHIAVNALNEYQDFTSGLDLMTDRTPFSGGSGALPAFPRAARGVFGLSLVALLLVLAYGLWLVWRRGPGILPVGLLGIVSILFYTRWINRRPLLCLLTPGLAFGPLMVLGGYWVFTGGYAWEALMVSLLPLLLASNLLLLNQYPDMAADARVGRRTLPIAFGVDNSNRVYLSGCWLSIGLVLLGVISQSWPALSLLSLVPLLLMVPVGRRIRSFARGGSQQDLQPALAMNVAMALVTSVVLGATLLVGAP